MARKVRYKLHMGKHALEVAIKTRDFDHAVPPGMFGGSDR
jgi:hypothetical protein